jgi:NTE family protein
MGADLVIAVNLNADILLRPGKSPEGKGRRARSQQDQRLERTFWQYWQRRGEQFRKLLPRGSGESSLSIFEVLLYSLNVMQDRITRQRLAADPPDFHIAPYLRHIQLLEFHRAKEAMLEGERAAQALLPAIQEGLARESLEEQR